MSGGGFASCVNAWVQAAPSLTAPTNILQCITCKRGGGMIEAECSPQRRPTGRCRWQSAEQQQVQMTIGFRDVQLLWPARQK